MKFGLFIPQGWRPDLIGLETDEHWGVMTDLARYADDGSTFESVWVYDHMHTVPEPSTRATYDAWTLMAAFAATTKRVKLGQMCTCMSYRNPAHLAKVAATVDAISGGRAITGIGAGWYEHEWRAYGYGFPRAGERIERLDEGVQIMKQMWETGSATFEGKHYQVDGALGYPQPITPGGMPLWIAGGGEKKTLRTAAKYATHTNFDGSLEGFAHKSAVLAEHCREVGRDFAEITRSASYNIIIGETEADVAERLDWLHNQYLRVLSPTLAAAEVDDLRAGPLVGTPEQILDKLTALGDLGMDYAVTYFPDATYDRRSLELFAQKVAPELA